MQCKYNIAIEGGVTVVSFETPPNYNDITTVIDNILVNYDFGKRLYDFSQIQFDFTLEEIKNIAAYGKTKYFKPNKMAVVALDHLAFGEMRQFEFYREDEITKAKVFRSKLDALQLLNEPSRI